MNHLKTFNSKLFTEEIIQDLKDICLELQDEGFVVGGIEQFVIDITKPKGRYAGGGFFTFKSVSDVILRIIDYVSEYGITFRILSKTRPAAGASNKHRQYEDITPHFKMMKYKIGTTSEIKIIF